ncbi:anti-sigma factor domain-containing protein [Sphingomonas sp. Leaf10]|uniref:anti-sigma factor n=1 Tax=Sphingomonas sp. Leaf10 TaxID=1735676 RepID=UPI000A7C6EE2|nr:anti-sigma factor [Sphingomonas sp. Leaf10]
MTDPDPDMMAAEYALGLLEGAERAAAMRRLLTDPNFAREVEGWRHRFAAMFDEYRPVTAPALQIDRIVAAPVAAPAPVRSGFRWAFVPLAAAITASVALLLPRPAPVVPPPPVAQPQPTLLAALTPTDQRGTPIAASIDLVRNEVRVVAPDLAPADKDAQLWILRDGVPHAIGLLARTGATRLPLPVAERALLNADTVLAVSIEPLGGSPEPTPTGPVVASGALART